MAESEKTKALDEVTFALLQDRETTHQRDEWAPVLKRLHIKFEAEALATRADSAESEHLEEGARLLLEAFVSFDHRAESDGWYGRHSLWLKAERARRAGK